MKKELLEKPAQFVLMAITLISFFLIFLIVLGEALNYFFPHGIRLLAFLFT